MSLYVRELIYHADRLSLRDIQVSASRYLFGLIGTKTKGSEALSQPEAAGLLLL